MADGLFDDLIPQAKRPTLGDAPAAAGGLFDDLVPRANPFADVRGGIDTTEALGTVGPVTSVRPDEVIVPEGIAPEPPGLGAVPPRAGRTGRHSRRHLALPRRDAGAGASDVAAGSRCG